MAFRLRFLIGLLAALLSTQLAAQDTAATVPSSFLGTYTTTYDAINSGGPFSQGEEVTLVLGADNTLCINGQTLTDPVHRNGSTVEAIWSDSNNNVDYAVSNFSSTFNEVNISGPNFSPFYGQLSGSKTSDSTDCVASSVEPEITAQMTNIFELAETKLPDLFPSGSLTLTLDQYVYRLYSTGIYLAFNDGNVFLLGGSFGDAIINAGTISSVASQLEAYPTPDTSGGGSASTALWNLNISGTFDTSFVQNLTFGGINVPGIAAPDLDDVDAVNQQIENTLVGTASEIGTITITVVENSASRRAFDASFTATTSIGQVTYNLRYDYTR